MDEEEMLKRMTRLLEQGCTMLASHHDCGAPLFRCKGEIICPACSPEGDRPPVASAKSTSVTPLSQGSKSEQGGSLESSVKSLRQASGTEVGKAEEMDEAEASTQEEQVLAKGYLRQVLLHRLKELARDVEKEGDLDKMHRQLDCIEGILRILSALER